MRQYTVAIASLAIPAPRKWTDNILSHHDIPGVIGERRGVARRISPLALLHLTLAREVHLNLGASVHDAVAIARSLLDDQGHAVLECGHLRVILDRSALEQALATRLRDALESAPSPRRGRPVRRQRVDAE
jgi:hypothetical protein